MAHEYEKLIKCPYCDYEWKDSWEFDEDEGTHTCGSCERDFNVSRNIEVTYCTTKIDCGDDEHDYHTESHHIFKREFNKGVWSDLPEEKWDYVRIDECSKCDDKRYVHLTKDEYSSAVAKSLC